MPKHVSLQNTLLIGLIWSVFYLGLAPFGEPMVSFPNPVINKLGAVDFGFKQGYFQVNSWSSLGFSRFC